MKTADLTGPALDWAVAKCDQEWSDEDAFALIAKTEGGAA